MSIFDKLNPVRTMDKIKPEKIKEKGLSFAAWTTGGKRAKFFDINDHDTISNGYNTNPYVYSVVNRLATLASVVPIKAQKIVDDNKAAKYKSLNWDAKISVDGYKLKTQAYEDVPDHRLQELIDYPNKENAGQEHRFQSFVNKYVTGNLFEQTIRPSENRPPTELWSLPPLSITPNESQNFYDKVDEYYFNWNSTSKTLSPELVMHSKYYNPLGSFWGLSPLSAARKAVQQINDADEWNAALLQNGAKPEFVLIVAPGTPDEEKQKLKQRWKDNYQGPYKASEEPLVIDEDFMKFESLGYTLKDMDWQNSQLTNMRKVYDVYGVASEIGNDPGNKTMSNKREAIRSLYTDKVLPDLEVYIGELNRWLVPMYNEDNLILTMDLSAVDALNEEKDKVAARMAQSEWLTMNEKREAMGYERIDNPSMDQPWLSMGKLPIDEIMLEPLTDEEKELSIKEYRKDK